MRPRSKSALGPIKRDLLDRCDEVSGVMKSLSHPVRLKILCSILDEEQSVNTLTDAALSDPHLYVRNRVAQTLHLLPDSKKKFSFIKRALLDRAYSVRAAGIKSIELSPLTQAMENFLLSSLNSDDPHLYRQLFAMFEELPWTIGEEFKVRLSESNKPEIRALALGRQAEQGSLGKCDTVVRAAAKGAAKNSTRP